MPRDTRTIALPYVDALRGGARRPARTEPAVAARLARAGDRARSASRACPTTRNEALEIHQPRRAGRGRVPSRPLAEPSSAVAAARCRLGLGGCRAGVRQRPYRGRTCRQAAPAARRHADEPGRRCCARTRRGRARCSPTIDAGARARSAPSIAAFARDGCVIELARRRERRRARSSLLHLTTPGATAAAYHTAQR